MFFTDNWEIKGYNITIKDSLWWYGSIIFERTPDDKKVVRDE